MEFGTGHFHKMQMRICVLFMLSMRVNTNFHMYSTLLLDIKIGEEISNTYLFRENGFIGSYRD